MLLALAAAISLLAGCASNDPGGAPDNQGGAPAGPSAASKTLSIALSENLVTLDPLDANNAPGYQPRNMCFDMLVESDHEGNYTTCLAESWEFSEDGTEITFRLRTDVKWHDGTDFTADDVVCTFQRLIDEPELNIASIYWSLLTGVEALDSSTVKITLSAAYAPVMNSLSVTAIIQKAQWEAEGVEAFNQQHFVGTGPWVFDQWIDGQYVHVTKNPSYWGGFDSYYDDVYLRFVLEASTAIAAHKNGDVQAYIASSGIAADNLSLYDGTAGDIDLVSINTGTSKSQESLLAVSDMLNEAGFKSSVEIVESAALTDLRATGDYDVFVVATMQENGEPYKYFNMRVLNDAHHSGFADEELNAWITASNSEMDPDVRRALLEKCVVRWSEDLVHLPLVRLTSTYAVSKGVTGIALYQDGLFNFKYVTHQ